MKAKGKTRKKLSQAAIRKIIESKIYKPLGTHQPKHEALQEQWKKYLAKTLAFPFRAEYGLVVVGKTGREAPEFIKVDVVRLDEVLVSKNEFYAFVHMDGLEVLAKFSQMKNFEGSKKTMEAVEVFGYLSQGDEPCYQKEIIQAVKTGNMKYDFEMKNVQPDYFDPFEDCYGDDSYNQAEEQFPEYACEKFTFPFYATCKFKGQEGVQVKVVELD